MANLISIDELLAILEEVRQNHYNAVGLSTTQRTNLATPYDTSKSKEKAATAHISEIQANLNNLSNSPYIGSYGVTIPAARTLLRQTEYTNLTNTINTVAGLCPHCNFFTAAAQQGNFGNFTSESSQGNFDNFSTASREGFFTSEARESWFSNFTSAARQGHFTTSSQQSVVSDADFTSAGSQGHFTTSSQQSVVSDSDFTTTASQRNFTTTSQQSNNTNFTTAARKGNFTSASSKGNFTTSGSQGDFANFSTTIKCNSGQGYQ